MELWENRVRGGRILEGGKEWDKWEDGGREEGGDRKGVGGRGRNQKGEAWRGWGVSTIQSSLYKIGHI